MRYRQQPPYQPYPPMPPQPPRRRRDDDDERGHGKLMLVLTLVGTLATVVSVLLAMGVGPFDVGIGGNRNDRDDPAVVAQDEKAAAQTSATYVDTVNRMCGEQLDSITKWVTLMNDAAATNDIAEMGRSLTQASTELGSLMTKIKGVRMPEDPAEAAPLQEWRDMYEKQADAMSLASTQWADGDYTGASATLNEAPGDTMDLKGDEVHISCP